MTRRGLEAVKRELAEQVAKKTRTEENRKLKYEEKQRICRAIDAKIDQLLEELHSSVVREAREEGILTP